MFGFVMPGPWRDDDLTIGLASSFSHLMLDRGRWGQVRQIRRVAAPVLRHPAAERAGFGVPLSSRAHLAVAARVLIPDKASLG
ncbi:hypothetical protein [Nonomuraea sp. NPDC003709]|uniref:hypothetical protein n=1 Tax=Nonomuraea sp. NPDC003709 TaxID=3154450 RepID=UPI0033AED69D